MGTEPGARTEVNSDSSSTSKLNAIQPTKQLPLMFGLVGFCIGLIVTLSFLSGDNEGRVNLLYLLILFVFLPVAGFFLSILSLVIPSGRGLAELMLELPVWPQHWLRELLNMGRVNVRRSWLFYLSQLLALSLGLGCLIAFFLILLVNDVSFVWRSTVLEASDLLPVLKALAIPWSFWPEAQPSLALLQLSQDFRLGEQNNNALELGQWWKYALAAQLTYNLLPRGVMLTISRIVYRSSQAVTIEAELEKPGIRLAQNSVPGEGTLAPIIHELAGPYILINWAAAPALPLEYLTKILGSPVLVENLSPGSGGKISAALLAAHPEATFVILVKGWEPPMGELKDYLDSISAEGVILPLDWDTGQVNKIRELHLREWRRFCGSLFNWSVLQPEKVS